MPIAASTIPTLSEDFKNKFFRFVEQQNNSCWEWTGAKCLKGYGVIKLNRRQFKASRIMLWITTQKQGESLFACHHCDNPSCVRPDHLFWGTQLENAQDMSRKGRGIKKWPENHPYRINPEKWIRGCQSANSSLTEDQVISIRDEYATGLTSYSKLGKKYGVAFQTIHRIVKRKRYLEIA